MTTTRAEALAELIAKVEAGEYAGVKKASSAIASSARDAGQYWPHHDILKAYFHGSLDAARALHQHFLPRHYAQLHMWPMPEMCKAVIGGHHIGRDTDPARAWLLAILRALQAQQEGAKG